MADSPLTAENDALPIVVEKANTQHYLTVAFRPTTNPDEQAIRAALSPAEQWSWDAENVDLAIECPGVTSACECWEECGTCARTLTDEQQDALDETGEAHGEEHQSIDGMWMIRTGKCLSVICDWHEGATELLHDEKLTAGRHAVAYDCEEGYVSFFLVTESPTIPHGQVTDGDPA